jgi:hypothetical protein
MTWRCARLHARTHRSRTLASRSTSRSVAAVVCRWATHNTARALAALPVLTCALGACRSQGGDGTGSAVAAAPGCGARQVVRACARVAALRRLLGARGAVQCCVGVGM